MTLLLFLVACRNGTPSDDLVIDSDTSTPCTPSDWYMDQDSDGYGAGDPSSSCEAPDAWIARDGDCDDADGSTFPGAEEIPYDDVDQDCDGSDLRDADGDGDPVDSDCDDADDTRASTFFERCNTGVDEDCDGVVDEDCQYFGGVASGEPDKRVLGVWVDEWQDRAVTGEALWVLDDLDGDGLSELGFRSRTYREDDFHFVRGSDLLAEDELDVDDAFLSLNADVTDGISYIQSAYTLRTSDSTTYISVHASSIRYNIASTATGSVGRNDAETRVWEEPYYADVWRDRGVAEDGTRLVFFHSDQLEAYPSYNPTDDSSPTWATFEFDSQPYWLYSIDTEGDGTAELFVVSTTEGESNVFLFDTAIEEGFHYDADDRTNLTKDTGFGDTYWLRPDPTLRGDLNRDGYEDVLMRGFSPDADQYGELWVYHQDGSWDPNNPDLRFVLPEIADGTALTLEELPMTLGDINGDDELDLALSLPDPDRRDANRVLLLLGPFEDGVVYVDEDPDGWLIGQDAAYEYGSEQHYGSRLGQDLAFLPDINGDGCDELLIGEPGYESNAPEDHGPGSVNLIFGAPGMP
ncbi:MAG: hypothetical protein ACI9VR_002537 [Cognaticolwellia sp.]|jgi:hypothetical protein